MHLKIKGLRLASELIKWDKRKIEEGTHLLRKASDWVFSFIKVRVGRVKTQEVDLSSFSHFLEILNPSKMLFSISEARHQVPEPKEVNDLTSLRDFICQIKPYYEARPTLNLLGDSYTSNTKCSKPLLNYT